MGKETKIQWCDLTWNVARGCDKVDKDCLYCYMYRQSLNNTRYQANQVTRTKTVFDLPLRYHQTHSQCWHGKPLVFTSSLTDVFHPAIDSYRSEMWDIIRRCPHLIFQILTKRPERITSQLPPDWCEGYPNVWLGTSVGHNDGLQRMIDLATVPAAKLFLSLEPLHGQVDIAQVTTKIAGIEVYVLAAYDWVIVGGESGNENGKYRYRPCQLQWIETIVGICQRNSIPVFVKQLGTHLAKQMGLKDRHGGDIEEFPKHLQVREFPTI